MTHARNAMLLSAMATALLARPGPSTARGTPAGQAAQGPARSIARVPPASQATEIRLRGDATLPITMVREFPFVEGSVAGVGGKLLLDTGAMSSLIVNDHRVLLAGGLAMGQGHFGSGQTFAVRLNEEVGPVEVGGLRYDRATRVASQDATQLEGVTPDFIGWVGYLFWEGYALKVDYRRLRATFYGEGPERFLAGERIVAALPFTTRRLPNHPVVPAEVGGVRAVAAFDTGQYGGLYTDAATKARLIAQGTLRPAGKGDDTYDLRGLTLGGRRFPDVPAIEVHTSAFPAAAGIGLIEPTILSLGYGLLRRYTTVWDYPRGRLYFLRP